MTKDPEKKLEALRKEMRKVKKQIANEKLERLAGLSQSLMDGELDKLKDFDTEQLRGIHETLSILFGSG